MAEAAIVASKQEECYQTKSPTTSIGLGVQTRLNQVETGLNTIYNPERTKLEGNKQCRIKSKCSLLENLSSILLVQHDIVLKNLFN